jgi:hypothetical protein
MSVAEWPARGRVFSTALEGVLVVWLMRAIPKTVYTDLIAARVREVTMGRLGIRLSVRSRNALTLI